MHLPQEGSDAFHATLQSHLQGIQNLFLCSRWGIGGVRLELFTYFFSSFNNFFNINCLLSPDFIFEIIDGNTLSFSDNNLLLILQ
jgi:hypothetical protein